MSFSTTACLEIFSTDYADGEFEMPTRGKAVPSTERLHLSLIHISEPTRPY